jgi:MFS family permease
VTLYTDGLGAGIFSIGYFLFEVPSSAILARVGLGARRWLARIVISWAILSGITAFVQTAGQYVVRFLIGAAEAGFAPGVIYCISTWFPNARRRRATSYLGTAIPIAFIIGAPVSGWILHSLADSTIMKPWQWLFVLEAIPALVAGVAQPSGFPKATERRLKVTSEPTIRKRSRAFRLRACFECL